MQFLIRSDFRRRILISALSISFAFLITIAYLVNQKHHQDVLLDFVSDIVLQMPSVINEIEQSGLLPDPEEWSHYYAPSSAEISAVICDKNDRLLWTSVAALLPGGKNENFNICAFLPDKLNKPQLFEDADGENFVAYKMMKHKYDKDMRIIVLKSANKEIRQLEQLEQLILIFIVALILLTIATLVLLFRWALNPVKMLVSEIHKIQENHQSRIEGNYPEELRATVSAFNRLLHQAGQQEKRYKNAMSDLAHGLKTRIATSMLLINEQKTEGTDKQPLITEQLSEMDSVVQYQLKRATLGAKGLSNSETSLDSVINKFEPMFSQFHQPKSIAMQRRFAPSTTLPIEEGDLIEIFGNIFENAYRYAQSQISVAVETSLYGYLVEVCNDGPAIEKSQMELLFARGIRADEINPGTGLGLAICREIMQSYGGDIWFDIPFPSELPSENGVCLKLFLPYRKS
ncbi:ATP-binding protein [Vibrio sp. JC009]|uniref:ATP-binding protein n=1 Tax=Vibrio sp. JC009 TaxID=2912314 RepID=UPI0023B09B5F|nr:ATP-binding protein [Vibrio sp. JC009]WED22308.1 ATP-binding protein [Vibrio sp. JC009]